VEGVVLWGRVCRLHALLTDTCHCPIIMPCRPEVAPLPFAASSAEADPDILPQVGLWALHVWGSCRSHIRQPRVLARVYQLRGRMA
jgi:hypothetical protein